MPILYRMLSRSTLRKDICDRRLSINGIMLNTPSSDAQWRWNAAARKYQYSYFGAKG